MCEAQYKNLRNKKYMAIKTMCLIGPLYLHWNKGNKCNGISNSQKTKPFFTYSSDKYK